MKTFTQKRILILGGAGMIGHQLFRQLSTHFPNTWVILKEKSLDPFFASIQNVFFCKDLTDRTSLYSMLNELKPNYIINAAGVTKRRETAIARSKIIETNSVLPHYLNEWCEKNQSHLIHFSTDCVFNGERGNYFPEDLPNATDLYGRSKGLGEVTSQNTLTLRTSLIGFELSHHTELLDWILFQKNKTVNGFKKAFFTGVTTLELSRVIHKILLNPNPLVGIFHLASDPISKYDLVKCVNETFCLNINLLENDSFSMNRQLNGDKLNKQLDYKAPSWKEMIEELKSDYEFYEKRRNLG